MTLFAIIIIVISLYFCFKKQYILVFIYSLCVSPSDSASLNAILELAMPNFTYLMEVLLFVASFFCVIQNKDRKELKAFYHYINYCYAILVCAFCLYFLQEFNETTVSRIIAFYISFMTNYGILSFLILICCIGRYNVRLYLMVLVLTHCILAFLTIYGSYIGLDFFNILNWDLYYSGLENFIKREQSPFLLRLDVLTILIDKWQIHVGSCFANSNILGVYSGTLILISLFDIFDKRNRIYAILCIIIGLILWFDAGTRAPLFSVLIVLAYISYSEKGTIKIIKLTVLFLVSILLYGYIVEYLYDSFNKSANAREDLFSFQWDFFLNNFFIGPSNDDNLPSSPHQLFLLYATRFGVLGLIFSIVFFYVLPIVDLLRMKKVNVTTIGLLSLLFCVGNTNNFTAIILYNTLFVYYLYCVYQLPPK